VKKAIVIGASSGIGRALAKVLSDNGYSVGLAARRVNLLTDLANELPTPSFVKGIDVAKTNEAMRLLRELITEMGDVELFVLSAGIGFVNPKLDWAKERDTLDVNVSGFAATANVIVEYLQSRGSGQADKAARQILSAIQRGKEHAYVTRRWRLVAWLMKAAPSWLYHRF
jgi:short-subunit dehydrogenase